MEGTNRRLKRALVTWEALSGLLTTQNKSHGDLVSIPQIGLMPSTARITAVYVVPERQSFQLIFEDESFDEVPEGLLIPENDDGMMIRSFYLSDKPVDELVEVL